MTDEHQPPDPDKVLTDLRRATLALGIRATWEIANRRGLLWAHSLWSLYVGTQILLYGGPGNVERTFGIWTRPTLGALAITGALLLAAGLRGRPRSLTREVMGLATLGLWDLCMTLSLLAARLQQGDFRPRALLAPQPIGYVVGYPVGVYALLLTLILIHLWTLTRLRDPGTVARLVRKATSWITWGSSPPSSD